MTAPRLGFFTRVLESGSPAVRYRAALDEIIAAEQAGFDTAWVAQHHFHVDEGGLPSPFVLLAAAAARTSRIVLGTGIITLPLEAPLRVAEDAAVLHALSDGRLELGVGSGGTPSSFPPFGFDPADRRTIYRDHLQKLTEALRGDTLTGDGGALYPAAPELLDTLWQATFSAGGAAAIGAAGHGLMLSRTQPRTDGETTLADVQEKVVAAYTAALPAGAKPRVFASRSVLVTDDEATAAALIPRAIERGLPGAVRAGLDVPADATEAQLLDLLDIRIGTASQVIDQFAADTVALAATDIVFQAHPVDPPHATVLGSIERIAEQVAPALGWQPQTGETA